MTVGNATAYSSTAGLISIGSIKGTATANVIGYTGTTKAFGASVSASAKGTYQLVIDAGNALGYYAKGKASKGSASAAIPASGYSVTIGTLGGYATATAVNNSAYKGTTNNGVSVTATAIGMDGKGSTLLYAAMTHGYTVSNAGA